MKNKIQFDMPRTYLELVVEYIERSIRNYRPDHEDVDLALRMTVLMKLRIRLIKRQTETMYANTIKITLPKDEALALLAHYVSDNSAPFITTDIALKHITGKAHKEWM
ncbi:MAG: hypothetical protein MH137_11255 [Flavobacteriales bacterium]|nr:hypothetical protein [Flavobacteriales bacterium]